MEETGLHKNSDFSRVCDEDMDKNIPENIRCLPHFCPLNQADIPYGFVGPCLSPFGHMVVDIPGHLAGIMTKPAGDNLKIHMSLRHQGDMSMPQGMGSDPATQDTQRIFLQILVIGGIYYMIAVEIAEK